MRKKKAYTAAVPAITANNQRKVITGVFPEEPELAGDGGVAEVLFILPLPVRELIVVLVLVDFSHPRGF